MLSKAIRWTIHNVGNLLRSARVAYLRMAGVHVGNRTMISLHSRIDVRRGRVVIGDGCHITYGCILLSHDHTAKVLGTEDNDVQRILIGDNVFVGVNSVVLPGVTIGDNSIIGAGSIVTRSIPPNVVAAGNPARIIRKIAVPV